jgi:hypothetical protein
MPKCCEGDMRSDLFPVKVLNRRSLITEGLCTSVRTASFVWAPHCVYIYRPTISVWRIHRSDCRNPGDGHGVGGDVRQCCQVCIEDTEEPLKHHAARPDDRRIHSVISACSRERMDETGIGPKYRESKLRELKEEMTQTVRAATR